MLLPLPIIGRWYQATAGNVFEVVACDLTEGTIDVQHFDGTVEELDRDEWLQCAPYEIDPPEDWTGSVDVEPEDHEDDQDATLPPTWSAPLEFLDRDEVAGYTEWEPQESSD